MITKRAMRWAGTMLFAAMCLGVAAEALAADAVGNAISPAPTSAASATERQSIASERAAVEVRFAARERECNARFIVTSCVDEAKIERREALDKLRARQRGADEARRRERAAQRQSELSEKAEEDARVETERAARAAAASASGAASQPARIRVSSPRRGAPPDRTASAASAHANESDKLFGFSPRPPETAASRQDREARSRAAFEKRQRQAAEHREEATTATLRRMASKSPAAPLPAASAASATKTR